MKLSVIANMIQGTLHGSDGEISGISNLEEQSPGTIAFAENKKFLELFENSVISALVLPENLESTKKSFIRVKNSKEAFTSILNLFSPYHPYENCPESASREFTNVYIGKNVKIGKNVVILPFTSLMDGSEIGDDTTIYPNCFIGKNVKIGKNCQIKSGVRVDDETIVGDRVIIQHNSVIGGEGFGYMQIDGKNVKFPQIGTIRIEDDVEIGSCVTVDRAAMGETVIGEGTKIDNLVQIAHSVKIGANSIVIAQSGIAGSSRIGKNCIITGQVGISDHVEIGDNVVILSRSGVEPKQVLESGKVYFGTPALDFMEEKRILSVRARLPELAKRVRAIEKKMEEKDETKE